MLPLILLLLVLQPDVQSQIPSPGPTKAGKNEQANTPPKQDEPNNDQRITQALTTAINQLAAEITAREKQGSAAPHEDEASSAWWSKASAAVSAVATVFIAYLGYRQWRSMQQQADLMRRSIILSQRPRLIVKNLALSKPSEEDRFINQLGDRLPFEPRVAIEGKLTVTNSGASVAIVGRSEYRVVNTGPPESIPRELKPHLGESHELMSEGDRIEPGQFRECAFTGLGPSLQHYRHPKSPEELNTYLIGSIEYRDELGVLRRTSFGRQYRRDLYRFVAIKDDPDYESAD